MFDELLRAFGSQMCWSEGPSLPSLPGGLFLTTCLMLTPCLPSFLTKLMFCTIANARHLPKCSTSFSLKCVGAFKVAKSLPRLHVPTNQDPLNSFEHEFPLGGLYLFFGYWNVAENLVVSKGQRAAHLSTG